MLPLSGMGRPHRGMPGTEAAVGPRSHLEFASRAPDKGPDPHVSLLYRSVAQK